MTLEERLILHEGIRAKPYKDTLGIWTIGCGRNMEGNGFSTIARKAMEEMEANKK